MSANTRCDKCAAQDIDCLCPGCLFNQRDAALSEVAILAAERDALRSALRSWSETASSLITAGLRGEADWLDRIYAFLDDVDERGWELAGGEQHQ